MRDLTIYGIYAAAASYLIVSGIRNTGTQRWVHIAAGVCYLAAVWILAADKAGA